MANLAYHNKTDAKRTVASKGHTILLFFSCYLRVATCHLLLATSYLLPTTCVLLHRQPKLTLRGKGVKQFTYHRWRVTFLLDASVSRYRRPLKIRDFVWEIKHCDLRTLNNVKSNFSFNEINKKDLPAIYSTVFRCLLVLLFFFFGFIAYRIYSINRPGRLLNFWTLRVGAYSRQGAYKTFTIFSKCSMFILQQNSKC